LFAPPAGDREGDGGLSDTRATGREAIPGKGPAGRPEFELVINLKTAKALGLMIPQSLLRQADQVIE
jgi:hypothetical protein